MSEILPCPFCGSPAKAEWFGFGELCEVVCDADHCGATGACKATEEAAIAAWNHRPAEDLLREETAIVDRIWNQLGRPSYKELNGRTIYDLIEELKARAAA